MEIFFTQTVNFLDFSFIQQAPIKVFSPSFFLRFLLKGNESKINSNYKWEGIKIIWYMSLKFIWSQW